MSDNRAAPEGLPGFYRMEHKGQVEYVSDYEARILALLGKGAETIDSIRRRMERDAEESA